VAGLIHLDVLGLVEVGGFNVWAGLWRYSWPYTLGSADTLGVRTSIPGGPTFHWLGSLMYFTGESRAISKPLEPKNPSNG
jgi:hypothetical protein